MLITLAIVSALMVPTFGRTSLDPDAATPGGARALAELLRDQGVTVERTTDVDRAMATGSSTTLVVAYPDLLRDADLRRLERLSADVVLLGPVATGAGYLGFVADRAAEVKVRQPQCLLAAATLSGDARTGGAEFNAPSSGRVEGDPGAEANTLDETTVTECFPADDAPTVVQVETANGAQHTMVGSAAFLTNEWLDEAGNASLAMNLTGQEPALVWWLPTPSYTGRESLTSLLPDGIWPLLAIVVVIVLALAFWRGQRLGPVVVEPLPVAVRASETTEGRARIYQRHRTRGRAAEHLREQSADVIVSRLGLPASAAPDAVVDAVAQDTGRRSDEVRALLYGPPPGGDQALVTLGRQLTALEQEVRRT